MMPALPPPGQRPPIFLPAPLDMNTDHSTPQLITRVPLMQHRPPTVDARIAPGASDPSFLRRRPPKALPRPVPSSPRPDCSHATSPPNRSRRPPSKHSSPAHRPFCLRPVGGPQTANAPAFVRNSPTSHPRSTMPPQPPAESPRAFRRTCQAAPPAQPPARSSACRATRR